MGNPLSDMREAAGIPDDRCEFCGEDAGGRPIRHAIDGAWAHEDCLNGEVPDEQQEDERER